MKNCELSFNLNNIISQFNGAKKYGELKFYCQNYLEQTTKILSESCPFGKIATLYFNSTYLQIGKNFSDHLKKAGFKPISVIMPDDFTNSLDDYAKLFNLHEDVRAVITFDSQLNYAVKYYSSIKNIPALHILTDLTTTDFISPKISIKNGNNLETVTLPCDQHVVIDKELCVCNLANIYAYVVSKTISLIDYKIYLKLYSKRFIKAPYDLLNTAINGALTCFNLPLNQRENALIENLMTVEIANRIMAGDVWCKSTENSVKILMGGIFSGYDRIAFVKYASSLYQKYFSNNFENLLEVPDYNQRASTVATYLKIDEKAVMIKLLNQIEFLRSSQEIIKQLKPIILEQVQKLEKLTKQISSTYHALNGGGKQTKNLKFCLYHSGDVDEYVNGMSLVRENGILEYLQV